MLANFSLFFFLSSADFFQNKPFKKFFLEHYQSVKQFGSRSGTTFCRSSSESKLFALGYEQTTKFPASKERVNVPSFLLYLHLSSYLHHLSGWPASLSQMHPGLKYQVLPLFYCQRHTRLFMTYIPG